MKLKGSLSAEQRSQLQAELQRRGDQRVNTNWMVLTGAPGSGKSTLLGDLRVAGLIGIDDPARKVIEQEMTRGLSKEAVRTDYMGLQYKILHQMTCDAMAANPSDLVVFDYALPDNLAFFAAAGASWTVEHVRAACRFAYGCAFLLETAKPGGSSKDPLRVEGARQKRLINYLLTEIYDVLGTKVVRVPLLPRVERAQLVFSEILTFHRSDPRLD